MIELENPDTPNEQFEFGVPMQQAILGSMLKDIYFMKQAAALLKPEYFVDPSHQMIARIILGYFQKYRKIPENEFIRSELSFAVKDCKKLLLYESELDLLYDFYEPGADSRDYFLDKIVEFAKVQTMLDAISKSVEVLKGRKEERFSKVYSILSSALRVDLAQDEGLDYFDTIESRYSQNAMTVNASDVFTSGFDTIDSALSAGGVSRGEIVSWVGQSGSGKSNLLVKAAVQNIFKEKKVLYISLELDEMKISERIDSQMTTIPIGSLLEDVENTKSSIREHCEQYEDKKRLVVKQFPGGTLDVAGIRAYLSQLELGNFKPDLLIVDYVGEMKLPAGVPTWDAFYHIVRDLRALAIEERIAVFTAMQPRREGREIQDKFGVLDDSNLGDSYAMVRPLDGLWSLNQAITEKQANVGRIFIAKHRSGKSRITFFYKQTNTLDMTEIDYETYKAMMSLNNNSGQKKIN